MWQALADSLANGGLPELAGNILAALPGLATPFRSCSAVPRFIGFIGFIEAALPLGPSFSLPASSRSISGSWPRASCSPASSSTL